MSCTCPVCLAMAAMKCEVPVAGEPTPCPDCEGTGRCPRCERSSPCDSCRGGKACMTCLGLKILYY